MFKSQWVYMVVTPLLVKGNLSWIAQLYTFMCKLLCRYVLAVLLGIYSNVELLDHMVTICSLFKEMGNCFANQQHCFPLLKEPMRFPIFPTPCSCFFFFLFYSFLKWSSLCEVISHCGVVFIFLLTNNVEGFPGGSVL